MNGLVEHYNNLTLKSLYAIKFFLEGFEGSLKPRFLMKVDDDNFVNLPLLYNQLVKKKKYSNAKALLMGHCWCHRARRAKVYPILAIMCLKKLKIKYTNLGLQTGEDLWPNGLFLATCIIRADILII